MAPSARHGARALPVALLLLASLPSVRGDCAMLGVCRPPGGDAFTARSVNCASPPGTPPVAPSFELSTCPEYGSSACCDATQHASLADNLGHARLLFGRCAACFENFRRLWCAFTCSPQQATFVNVTSSRTYPDSFEPSALVTDAAEFAVTPSFGQGVFSSCASVQFPSTGRTVLQTFGWDASFTVFLSAQGLALPAGYSPFQITFAFDKGGNALDAAAAGCDDARGGFACSPEDCAAAGGGAACPLAVSSHDAADAPAAAIALSSLLAAAVAAAAVAAAAATLRSKAADDAEEEEAGALSVSGLSAVAPPLPATDDDRPPNSLERLAAACAAQPVAALGGAFAIAALAFALAATRLRVATDPRELWVPPHSRSAMEASASVALFGPFWRVTQIVATPADGSRALTQAHVAALLALQASLEQLVTPRGISLSDVCYKPGGDGIDDGAGGGGEAAPASACLLQSPTSWFQNDAARIAAPPDGHSFDTWLRGGGDSGGGGGGGGGRWAGCLANAAHPACLAPSGIPSFPNVALGGYTRRAHSGGGGRGATRNDSSAAAAAADPWDASSLVATYLLSAGTGADDDAAEWEAAALGVLLSYGAPSPPPPWSPGAALNATQQPSLPPLLTLAFSTERSLSDELGRETGMDAPAVGAAFASMFAYVGFTLAPRNWHPLRRAALAAGGLALVAASLAAAAAAAVVLGLRASLISAEVVPFLVLACGVDNMFVLTHAWAAASASPAAAPLRAVEKAARSMHAVGAAVSAAAAAETGSLLIAALLAPMPAVRGFAAAAALAVAADAVLQVTAFVALLALCDPGHSPRHEGPTQAVRDAPAEPSAANEDASGGAAAPLLLRPPEPPHPRARFPLTLRHRPAAAALVLCGAAVAVSLSLLPTSFLLPLGLDQSSALPPRSYLSPYFAAVSTQMEAGPPIYWEVSGGAASTTNASGTAAAAAAAAAAADDDDDATNPHAYWTRRVQLSMASMRQRLTACGSAGSASAAAARLAGGPSDWLGDFLRWIDPATGLCTTSSPWPPPANASGSSGTSSGTVLYVPPPCSPRFAPPDGIACHVCAAVRDPAGANRWVPVDTRGVWQPPHESDASGTLRPTKAAFLALLPRFLNSSCSASRRVALCGAPASSSSLDTAYSSAAAASVAASTAASPSPPPAAPPVASRLASYHSPLRSQADLVDAFGAARRLADALSAADTSWLGSGGGGGGNKRGSTRGGARVAAFSPFYVFFEQYAGLRSRTCLTLLASLVCVVAASSVALRSARAAVCLALCVAAACAASAAAAAACGAQLNALFAANVAAGAGIATEFGIHVAAAGAAASSRGAHPRDAAAVALRSAGALVAKGVVATKLIGVACLGFAATQVFRTYYFKMYATLVLAASLSSLLLLPAMLAVALPARRGRGAGDAV